MDWSKSMMAGYITAIILGAVIGSSFAPAWSGYAVLTGLALLPIVIYLKSATKKLSSRNQLIRKLRLPFGGISYWLWGIIIASIAGSVILAMRDTDDSGAHELVTPILQSIVAAFIFYVIDVVYPKNKREHSAKNNYLRPLKSLTQRAYLPLKFLSKDNPKRISDLDVTPENIKTLLSDFNQNDRIPVNPEIEQLAIGMVKMPSFKDEWQESEVFTNKKAKLAIEWYGDMLPPEIHDSLFQLTQCSFFGQCLIFFELNEQLFVSQNICQIDSFINSYSEYLTLCSTNNKSRSINKSPL